jgi:hypothetical protein
MIRRGIGEGLTNHSRPQKNNISGISERHCDLSKIADITGDIK